MNPAWDARRAELRGRNPLPPRPDVDLDFRIGSPKVAVAQYPKGPLSPEAHLVRYRIALRHAPIPHRCGVVRSGPCKEALPDGQALRHIGRERDLGFQVDLYQCAVCHQVVTEIEAGVPGW